MSTYLEKHLEESEWPSFFHEQSPEDSMERIGEVVDTFKQMASTIQYDKRLFLSCLRRFTDGYLAYRALEATQNLDFQLFKDNCQNCSFVMVARACLDYNLDANEYFRYSEFLYGKLMIGAHLLYGVDPNIVSNEQIYYDKLFPLTNSHPEAVEFAKDFSIQKAFLYYALIELINTRPNDAIECALNNFEYLRSISTDFNIETHVLLFNLAYDYDIVTIHKLGYNKQDFRNIISQNLNSLPMGYLEDLNKTQLWSWLDYL